MNTLKAIEHDNQYQNTAGSVPWTAMKMHVSAYAACFRLCVMFYNWLAQTCVCCFK